jgi:hypothetical protein
MKDPVYADLVGKVTNIRLNSSGNEVTLRIPVTDYYKSQGKSVPALLSFTIATARDYVGFIDQISVHNIRIDNTELNAKKTLSPSLYPPLNYDSHVVKRLTAERTSSGAVRIQFETAAEIQDWAQTDLHFFFVPYPAHKRGRGLFDPSHSLGLPFAWSYLCGLFAESHFL